MTIDELSPEPDESLEDFASRVHDALDSDVPASERQELAFKAWDEAHGDPLEEMGVGSPFPRDKFTRVRNVPIFAEHTTTGRDGKLMVYDRAALAAIAERCNGRIKDTGDFAPITAGHTPDKDQLASGMEQPPVLGYAGPFRLGRIGNQKQRWAIFADEWRANNELQRFERLRRRSPEVWLEERMEDRILDPIAALGAETPRLDLGLTKLCRTSDGREVAKYQMYPGASNVSVPGWGKDKKQAPPSAPATPGENGTMAYKAAALRAMRDAVLKYAAGVGSPPSNVPGSPNQLSPELVDQIIVALAQTEPFQFLLNMMEQGPQHAVDQPEDFLAPPTDGSEDPEHPMEEEAPVSDESTIPKQGEEALEDAPKPPKEGKTKEGNDFLKDEEFDGEDEKKSYGAMSDEDKKCYAAHKRGMASFRKKYACTPDGSVEDKQAMRDDRPGDVVDEGLTMQTRNARPEDPELKARYARQQREIEELRNSVAQLSQAREAEQKSSRENERYNRLSALHNEFVFDIKDEVESTKDLSDEQFNRHCGRIVANYSRIPLGVVMYTPPLEVVESDRQTRELADAAVERVQTERAKGNAAYSFAQARADVRKERGIKTA